MSQPVLPEAGILVYRPNFGRWFGSGGENLQKKLLYAYDHSNYPVITKFHVMTTFRNYASVKTITINIDLKRQCHEIFDPRFFSLPVNLGPLIHGLKRFCI
jgi:hypothetical protein